MKKTVLSTMVITLLAGVCIASPFDYKTASNGYRYVYHQHNEASYQNAYCKAHKGIEEYELKDKTRVDCLTDTNAIEFDFANKAYEAVGQALHYGIMTGKKPKVVLILDGADWKKQLVYYHRIKKIGETYNFDVEYVTDDILQLDENGNCIYVNCKCHKQKK